MKKLLVMDAKDYGSNLEEIKRIAVRGIIFVEGKLLMIESAYGELKLPGGGVEPMEEDAQALMREVKEETGYEVFIDSIKPFGEIEEKRLSTQETKIFHQFSRLYFCDVAKTHGTCEYTQDEIERGFRQVFYTIDEALQKNHEIVMKRKDQNWNEREYQTLYLIKAYLEQANQS